MTEVTKDLLLFSGRSALELTERIAQILEVNVGSVNLESFANGEIYARYLQSVRGGDVFIVQSVASSEGLDVNAALMELLIMVDAAKRASAHYITAVITHFGYSRQDKKSASREPITAKLVANMLTVAGVDRVITVDLHQGQIQGFFDIAVNHLTALPLFANYFNELNLENVCVVSPDVGRAKAAKKLSDLLDAELAIMHKGRPKHNVAEITSLIGDVKGKTCILNDDIIDTGGTLIAAIKTLRAQGAAEVYVCATHGLLSGSAVERLNDSEIVECIVCDTVPLSSAAVGGKIKTVSVAPLLAQAVSNVFNNRSVSTMFDPDFAL
jgi:ribose-phosphate pyrophosphokinase